MGATVTRVLVVGKTGRIEDLLKRRFSAREIHIDLMTDPRDVLNLPQRERYHIVFFEALRLEPDLLRAVEHLDLMYRKRGSLWWEMRRTKRLTWIGSAVMPHLCHGRNKMRFALW
jgi:hypothetical protein